MFKLNDYNNKFFEVLNEVWIEERNLRVVELRHIVTKASILLFICDDKNRVFNIAFKTPVNNSKGAPHILEHSVLCGSRKYNVKDPFIELAKTSMNTFLNAMTYPDKTCYPVASANLTDFHNLVDVYLDAVFYPNAIKNDKIFKQEGWHYEISDRNSPLKTNGVVLNEMKGVYSNPDSILETDILKNIYANTNYAYEYGGEPNEIINLDFDEFKRFHDMYYSASNSIIAYYGKLDFNYELESLQKNYLQDFSFVDVDAHFIDPRDYHKNNEMVSYYSIDNEESINKAYFSYSFSIDGEKRTLDSIVIKILDYILFSSESAIIRNKLLELGLGESVYSFCEFSLKNILYSIVSQNIAPDKKDEFKNVLISSIEELIKNGIDENVLKAGINSLYFSFEEENFGRTPRGLMLILGTLETYLYSNDFISHIQYKSAFDYLNSIDLSDKNNTFYQMLKSIFIDNEHSAINVLLPKFGLIKENEQKIAAILDKKKKELSDNEIDKIIVDYNELKEYQKTKDTEEALKCIPSLKIADLEPTADYIDYNHELIDNVDTVICYNNDKDIIYLSLKFDISDFTNEEIYLFGIVSRLVSKLDIKSMTYAELDNYIDINTGGFDIKINIFDKIALFSMELKVIHDKCDFAFDVIYKLLTESIFSDTKRIAILTNEMKANSLVSIISAGHISAAKRAGSTINFSCNLADKIDLLGIAFYKFINKFTINYEKKCELINTTFGLLFKKLYSKKMYLTVSMNKKYRDEVINSYKKFNERLIRYKIHNVYSEINENELKNCLGEIVKFIPFDSFDKKVHKEAIVVSSDVNYVAVANSFDKNLYSGGFKLIKTIFNYEYLWTNIRVLGGAYGCMSFFDRSGLYTFVSYRDPNLTKTNETFYGIYEYLKNETMSNDTIEKYIIGSVGDFDNPLSIIDSYHNNIAAYFDGIKNEETRHDREILIHMKNNDVKKLSDIFKNIVGSNAVAIIGDKSYDEAKNNYDEVWKLVE